jgi:hypothetical protein
MKKTAIFTIFVLLVALVCVYVVAACSLDGAKAWFISHSPGFDDSTVYASGYSEHAFRSISVGMNTQELVRILGTPFHIWPAPPPPESRVQCMNWSYTKSSKQKSLNICTKEGFNIRLRVVGVYDGKVSYKYNQLKLDTCYSYQ